MIEPGQVGVVRRFGRYRPPLLGPGLHVRWPAPIESVIAVEPDRSRLARDRAAGPGVGGRRSPSAGMPRTASAATSRRSFSPAMKTWSSWPEWSNIASTKPTLAGLLFGVADVESSVASSGRGGLSRGGRAHAARGDPGQRPARIRGGGRRRSCKQRLQTLGRGRRGRTRAGGRCPSAARGGAGLSRRFVGRV